MAIEGFGTSISVDSDPVVELLSVTNAATGESIDVTHMDSDDAFREKIAGLVDAGQLELELQYTKGYYNTLQGKWRQTVPIIVTFPDGSTFACSGHLTNLGLAVTLDDKITQPVTFDITGKPVFTPAA